MWLWLNFLLFLLYFERSSRYKSVLLNIILYTMFQRSKSYCKYLDQRCHCQICDRTQCTHWLLCVVVFVCVFCVSLQSENGADSVYSLSFTSRETDCLVRSNKPWTECDYLPHGRKVMRWNVAADFGFKHNSSSLINQEKNYFMSVSLIWKCWPRYPCSSYATPLSTWQRLKQILRWLIAALVSEWLHWFILHQNILDKCNN